MKKQFQLLISFLVLSSVVFAQTTPMVLVYVQGNIKYKGESKKSLDIGPGALLSINGTIKLDDKSNAMILCNSGFQSLSKGKTAIKKICGGTDDLRSINFDGTFSDYILSAIELTHLVKDQNSGWINVQDEKMMAGDG
ncbi:MAG: hypothetical protein ABIO44_10160, partial [Saprospiraceae bacterium]